MSDTTGRQRIDKWLWFARVVKSRTLAQKLVAGGRVRINREKTLVASHAVKPGDVLTITLERQVRVLRILDPGERRGPATEAAMLYDDISAPPAEAAAAAVRAGPRPTKRDRRAMDGFLGEAGSDGGWGADDED